MTTRVVDRPERVFQMWGFTVSMGRLLLRSAKSQDFSTRIDVLFQDVKAVSLPALLDGLVVSVAGPEEEARVAAETGLRLGAGAKCFLVESAGIHGFVIAAVAVEDEDEGEYFEASKYWPGHAGETSVQIASPIVVTR